MCGVVVLGVPAGVPGMAGRGGSFHRGVLLAYSGANAARKPVPSLVA